MNATLSFQIFTIFLLILSLWVVGYLLYHNKVKDRVDKQKSDEEKSLLDLSALLEEFVEAKFSGGRISREFIAYLKKKHPDEFSRLLTHK